MNVFVTGATGLLGSSIVRALRWEGHKVKVLVRSIDKAKRVLNDPGLSYTVGDLLSVDSWARDLDGAEAVFHTAAAWTKDLHQTNVKAFVHLLTAAERAGARRLIHFTSVDTATANDPFLASKLQGEDAAQRFARHNRLKVATVVAGRLLGPGAALSSPFASAFLQVASGRACLPAKGGTCIRTPEMLH